MKAKIWIPVVIVLVAAAAFVVGWQLNRAPAGEQAAYEELPPPPEMPPPAAEQPPPGSARPEASGRVAQRRAAQPAAPAESSAQPAATLPPPAADTETPTAATGTREVQPRLVRIPEGTKITFTLSNALSTKTAQQGDPFSGVVNRSVQVENTLAIPEGSVIRGVVAHVERPGRVKGRAELGLRVDELELPDGESYDLSASLTQLDEARKETVTEEGQMEGEGTKKRDAITIGAGAGIGAAIGAIAGGGKGAGTGAAIGAGAGTAAVLLTRGKDIELTRGTELAVQLNRPLSLVVQ